MPQRQRSKGRRPALDPQQVCAWLAAAERGDLSEMKRMVASEPGLVDALGTGPYWTGNFRALHYAAFRGHRRVIRWLLAQGASAAPVAGDGDWAPIHFAAMPPKPAVVELLREHGAAMDIFAAAVLGDVKTVRRMLGKDPSLVSRRGPDGATPLHFAGSPAVAKALLEAGGDPKARDRFHKQTAIEWTSERPDVVAVLLGKRADADIHLAAARGDGPRVKALLARDGSLVNARVPEKRKTIGDEGETPLALAARYGQRRMVAFLLRHGADANARPSPLPGAVHRGDLAIVRRLLAAGADPDAFGSHGHAALHAAAVYGKLPLLRLLVDAGARLALEDREHQATPLGWAEYHQHGPAAAFLRARGGGRPAPGNHDPAGA